MNRDFSLIRNAISSIKDELSTFQEQMKNKECLERKTIDSYYKCWNNKEKIKNVIQNAINNHLDNKENTKKESVTVNINRNININFYYDKNKFDLLNDKHLDVNASVINDAISNVEKIINSNDEQLVSEITNSNWKNVEKNEIVIENFDFINNLKKSENSNNKKNDLIINKHDFDSLKNEGKFITKDFLIKNGYQECSNDFILNTNDDNWICNIDSNVCGEKEQIENSINENNEKNKKDDFLSLLNKK